MTDIIDIAPLPGDEADRLRVLRSYDILDTDPEDAFEDVIHLAARICDAPMAMVSLAAGDRLWFKARIGIDAEQGSTTNSFCWHAMRQPNVMIVGDTTRDARFADHPMVTGEPGLRFYAGAALVDDQGLALGALCVMDTTVRGGLDETQTLALEVLAKQIMAQLERRRELIRRRQSDEAATLARETAATVSRRLAESDARFQAIADSMPQMVWSSDAEGGHDYYNARWYAFTGVAVGSTDGEGWNGMFHPEDRERAWALWRHSLATGDPYEIEYRLRRHDGVYRWTLGRAAPIRDGEGRIVRWFGTCTDIDDIKRLEKTKALLTEELSHRIKNIFAVISALLALSARQFPEAKAFAKSARTRIAALARAHEFVRPHTVTSRSEIGDTTLQAFLRDLFLPYDDDGGHPRVVVRGDDADFDDQAATPVALLFHELATNSAKYGALSAPEGCVALDMEKVGDRFVLTWEETGGPPVPGPPERAGFGSSLLALSVEGQLGGRLERVWEPSGLRVIADIPATALARRRAARGL